MSKQSTILCKACGHVASTHTHAKDHYEYNYDSDGDSCAEQCNCDVSWKERELAAEQRDEEYEDELMQEATNILQEHREIKDLRAELEQQSESLNKQLRELFRNISPREFLERLQQSIDQSEKETRGDE